MQGCRTDETDGMVLLPLESREQQFPVNGITLWRKGRSLLVHLELVHFYKPLL